MRKLAAFALGVLGASTLIAEPLNLLREDWEEAVEKAVLSTRPLVVAFMGEGWSMTSNRFYKEVLLSESFREFASENLILCTVPSRRKPKLTKEEIAHLQALVIHFDIQSWPTIIICNPDGTEILRHGYKDLSGAEYVALLRRILPLDGTN